MATKSNLKPMPSVWRSLLWKEWQEQKSKLALLFLLLVILAIGSLQFGDTYHSWVEIFSYLMIPYGILAGLFVGMGTAASEQQRGTMRFMQSLPITTRRAGILKLGMSCLIVSAPILLLLLTVSLSYPAEADTAIRRINQLLEKSWDGLSIAEQKELFDLQNEYVRFTDLRSPFHVTAVSDFGTWLVESGIFGTLFTMSLLIWMATCGVNRSDEIRAGAIGFLVMVCVWAALLSALTWAEKAGWHFVENCITVLMVGAPGGPAFINKFSSVGFGTTWPYIAFAALTHVALIYQFLSRYGRASVRPARSAGERFASAETDWVLPARKSQLTAIVWKQVSETGPLAIVAAAAVLLIAGVLHWLDNVQVRNYSETLAGTALGVGYLVTVVAGMGVFLEDVKPKIGGFWRSRPVNVSMWFFVKYFTGLTVVALSFGTLFVIASVLPSGNMLFEDVDALQLTVFALVFLLTYSISMASYCLGRHPIVAVVATLVIMYSGAFGYSVLVNRDIIRWHAEVGIGMMVVGLAVATVLAWLALRNNWGWHNR